MKHPLSFRPDGTFTIVQFTDVHMKAGGEADLATAALMESILEAEKPDLVVFTGDVVEANACDDPVARFTGAVSVVERASTPWAIVFGNHDTESRTTRRQLMDKAVSFHWSVAEHGPDSASGEGNYALTVTGADDRPAAVLYFLDSGSVSPNPRVKGYGWVHRDQIDWYEHDSRRKTADNGGTPLPALGFFHIPLPEYDEVWDSEVCYGHKYERVCCPKVNTGLFAAMVEMGDVIGTFAGHDHTNDYWGNLHGIRLCYGRATGYNTYGREGFPRGARVIRLREGERSFESWLRLDDGTVIANQPEHRPDEPAERR
ncbi:metallophosphoesterase family protein [Paenibacillus doosanensis]|uniref:metallophosphoesterase family protein n=1 Tax=Paenibacillus doosanensis TaxID=1229154 RepID=UPI0021805E0B|nr:metallophosphoesterase family protein [Paenibacillus doosanensis]MCS7461683.1 metallophosphoesterase family protein [Paenibacillus doosanensis]